MAEDATPSHRADSGEEQQPSPAREATPPPSPEASQEEAVAPEPPASETSAEGSPWSLPSLMSPQPLVEVERPSMDPGRPVTAWRDVPPDERVAWYFQEISLCHLQIV
ncbi:uncharacterized protein [Eleutherodactylus coqui]|uniref:uncharacterized protein n=1 Tax=Eleutherodactylus coqui TaxID=57060 RepID=UPI0034633557